MSARVEGWDSNEGPQTPPPRGLGDLEGYRSPMAGAMGYMTSPAARASRRRPLGGWVMWKVIVIPWLAPWAT